MNVSYYHPEIEKDSNQNGNNNDDNDNRNCNHRKCQQTTHMKKRKMMDAISRIAFSTFVTPASTSTKTNSNTSSTNTDANANANITANNNITTNEGGGQGQGGRGSISGWISCPLCGTFSQKKFSMGRGIAAHLNAIHTPWKPSKLAIKIQRRKQEHEQRNQKKGRKLQVPQNEKDAKEEREQQEQEHPSKKQKLHNNIANNDINNVCNKSTNMIPTEPWEPTQDEVDAWNQQMINIIKKIEEQQPPLPSSSLPVAFSLKNTTDTNNMNAVTSKSNIRNESSHRISNPSIPTSTSTSTTTVIGVDRTGKPVQSYKASLPPFLQAAAQGDLKTLKQMVDDIRDNNTVTDTTITSSSSDDDKDDDDNDNNNDDDDDTSGIIAASNKNNIDNRTTIPFVQYKNNHNDYNTMKQTMDLLNTKDRHMSTADHWAAGGGHLECLKFILELRSKLLSQLQLQHQQQQQRHSATKNTTTINTAVTSAPSTSYHKKVIRRRRDGKTCLHYAARNGHLHCIQYLLSCHNSNDNQGNNSNKLPFSPSPPHHHNHPYPKPLSYLSCLNFSVHDVCGEGSTALHMACYGGHIQVVKYLIVNAGANPFHANDWGCTAAHWIGMTISQDSFSVRAVCNFLLQQQGKDFFLQTQNQGHSILHKAAQKCNKHVIEWLADTKSYNDNDNDDDKIIDKSTGAKKTTATTINANADIDSKKDNKGGNEVFDQSGAGLSGIDKEKVGRPDLGGHKPSEIWCSMGGDVEFGKWMISLGW